MIDLENIQEIFEHRPIKKILRLAWSAFYSIVTLKISCLDLESVYQGTALKALTALYCRFEMFCLKKKQKKTISIPHKLCKVLSDTYQVNSKKQNLSNGLEKFCQKLLVK